MSRHHETAGQLRNRIIAECLRNWSVTMTDLYSDRRSDGIKGCRGELSYRLHEQAGMSYPEIARLMGRKSHSALWSAADRHAKRQTARVA